MFIGGCGCSWINVEESWKDTELTWNSFSSDITGSTCCSGSKFDFRILITKFFFRFYRFESTGWLRLLLLAYLLRVWIGLAFFIGFTLRAGCFCAVDRYDLVNKSSSKRSDLGRILFYFGSGWLRLWIGVSSRQNVPSSSLYLKMRSGASLRSLLSRSQVSWTKSAPSHLTK